MCALRNVSFGESLLSKFEQKAVKSYVSEPQLQVKNTVQTSTDKSLINDKDNINQQLNNYLTRDKMQNISDKIPSIVLAVLMVITLVICGLFYAGSTEAVECTSGSFDAPSHTDTMINWIYILIMITGITTVGLAIVSFVIKLAKDPKAVIVPSVAMCGLALMLIISFSAVVTYTRNNKINTTNSMNLIFKIVKSFFKIYPRNIKKFSTFFAFKVSVMAKSFIKPIAQHVLNTPYFAFFS